MLKINFCFVPSLTVAEKPALLSLHLRFVVQYKFFLIIIILSLFYIDVLFLLRQSEIYEFISV